MRRAILARHGESEYSAYGRLNGDITVAVGLTARGREEARRLGEDLRGEQLDLCVTSEFQRARETADIALEGRDVARLVDPRLNDPLIGRYEGSGLEKPIYIARRGDGKIIQMSHLLYAVALTIHSWLRWLVLLIGLIAFGRSAVGASRRTPRGSDRSLVLPPRTAERAPATPRRGARSSAIPSTWRHQRRRAASRRRARRDA